MNDSWMALYLSIVIEVVPEVAFNMLEYGNGKKKNRHWAKADIEDFVIYKNRGYSLAEIAEIFGTTKTNASKRWSGWIASGRIIDTKKKRNRYKLVK